MNDKLPTREECLALLEKSGCNKGVIKHCLAVEDLAVRMAELAKADKELVSVGALLHDIGRARTHGVDHAVAGANIARELGLCEAVILIIERHIGAGITKDEADKIKLPAKDYIPRTLEEKIVAHADNLIEETRKIPVRMVVGRFEALGYDQAAKMILNLHKELSKICKLDLDQL